MRKLGATLREVRIAVKLILIWRIKEQNLSIILVLLLKLLKISKIIEELFSMFGRLVKLLLGMPTSPIVTSTGAYALSPLFPKHLLCGRL